MENYLFSQAWEPFAIQVGMRVQLGADEVNTYKPDGTHYMSEGQKGRLVAMWVEDGTNEDGDPECVVRLDNGDQVLCLGQDIMLWGLQ